MSKESQNLDTIVTSILTGAASQLELEARSGLESIQRFTDYNIEIVKDSIKRVDDILDNYESAIQSNIRSSLISINYSLNMDTDLIQTHIQTIISLRHNIFNNIKINLQDKIKEINNVINYMTITLNLFINSGISSLNNIFKENIIFVFDFARRHLQYASIRFNLYQLLIYNQIKSYTRILNIIVSIFRNEIQLYLSNTNNNIEKATNKPIINTNLKISNLNTSVMETINKYNYINQVT